jgi:hypothetical protein
LTTTPNGEVSRLVQAALLEGSIMAVGDELARELQALLHLLEQTNLEAVKAKQQLARVIGPFFETGITITFADSFFTVEGINYHASLTFEQKAAIQAAAGGTTQEVIDVVLCIRSNMVVGTDIALGLIIAVLQSQPLTAVTAFFSSTAGASIVPPPLGACIKGGHCSPNVDPTTCQTNGGQPVPNCSK